MMFQISENIRRHLKLSATSIRIAEIILGIVLLINYFDFYCIQDLFFNEKAFLHINDFNKISSHTRIFPSFFSLTESYILVNCLLLLGSTLAIFNIAGFYSRNCLLGHFILLNIFYERFPIVFGLADMTLRLTVVWFFFLRGIGVAQDDESYKLKGGQRRDTLIVIFWHIQVVLVYFMSAYEKLKFPEWSVNYDAIMLVSKIDRSVSSIGSIILNGLPPDFLKMSAMLVLFLEGVLIFLMLVPNKKVKNFTIILFILFHVLIFMLMNVHIMSVLFLVWWVVFIPQCFWEKFNLKYISGNIFNRGIIKRHASYLKIKIEIIVLYSIFINIIFSSLEGLNHSLSSFSAIARGARLFHMSQTWSMFSNPAFEAKNSFVVAIARLEDGTLIDPFTLKFPDFNRNPIFARTERSMHFVNFHKKFVVDESDAPGKMVNLYFCDNWSGDGKGRKILKYQVFIVAQNFTGNRYKKLLLSESCPPNR